MRTRLVAAAKIAAFHVLRHMPAGAVSALGGALVRWSVPRHRPQVLAGARANVRRHRPGATDDEVEAVVRSFLDNVGRVMAEFCLLHRLVPERRVHMDETTRALPRVLDGPAIAIGLHTGNWEIGAVVPRSGIKLASLSVIPEDPAERAIAARMRAALGCEVFPATVPGLRRAMDWLAREDGPRILAIYGDQARAGRLMAPLFGRPPAASGGNLALVARLARRSRARLLVCHVTRTGGCRFAMATRLLPDLPQGATPAQDVALLNAAIEPVVLGSLGQWYFLDNPF